MCVCARARACSYVLVCMLMLLYWCCLQRMLSVSHTQITGGVLQAKTVTVVVRGSNKLVLEEADRSIHDALCVVRCLVKNR